MCDRCFKERGLLQYGRTSTSGGTGMLLDVERMEKRDKDVTMIAAERIRVKCEKEGRSTFKFKEFREERLKVYDGN